MTRRLFPRVNFGLRLPSKFLSLDDFHEVLAGWAECAKNDTSGYAGPCAERLGRVAVAKRHACRDYIFFQGCCQLLHFSIAARLLHYLTRNPCMFSWNCDVARAPSSVAGEPCVHADVR